MRRAINCVILALAFAVLAGCSPGADGLVKKNTREQARNQSESGNDISVGVEGRLLDSETRTLLGQQGKTIRHFAQKYELDWRFVLAVMKAESRFDVSAKSHRGAVGLMQIMPTTIEELGKALDIDVMADPRNNIHGGVYYLKRLHSLFPGASPADRLKLTLAAYNAGLGRVYDAQDLAAYLEENPNSWESVRDALPLLSKRYYTLHKGVWEADRPRTGWFGNARETVAYVDKAMGYYEDYRLVLN